MEGTLTDILRLSVATSSGKHYSSADARGLLFTVSRFRATCESFRRISGAGCRFTADAYAEEACQPMRTCLPRLRCLFGSDAKAHLCDVATSINTSLIYYEDHYSK